MLSLEATRPIQVNFAASYLTGGSFERLLDRHRLDDDASAVPSFGATS